jgi:hypothetical protein
VATSSRGTTIKRAMEVLSRFSSREKICLDQERPLTPGTGLEQPEPLQENALRTSLTLPSRCMQVV